MHDIAVHVLPLILIFFLGMLLKKYGILKKSDADLLLKLFFYVSLPALILLSIPGLQLDTNLLFLPLSAASIVFGTYLVSFFSGKSLRLNRSSFAVFLIGSMIMNGGFAFPFILTAYGEEGMALASLFDFGSALVVFTFVYYQACRYGREARGGLHLLRKFLCSPPLLALLLAFALNLTGTGLGDVANAFLEQLAQMTTPLVLLALGVAFNSRMVRGTPVLSAVAIRMGIGFLLGLSCVELFALEGLSGTVTLLMASAPSGVNTLAFSSMEKLDTELAAGIVSYATLLGLIWLPLLIYMRA